MVYTKNLILVSRKYANSVVKRNEVNKENKGKKIVIWYALEQVLYWSVVNFKL